MQAEQNNNSKSNWHRLMFALRRSSAGHNMSQMDGDSTGDDSDRDRQVTTGTGCYKNYEHFQISHRKSNTSQVS